MSVLLNSLGLRDRLLQGFSATAAGQYRNYARGEIPVREALSLVRNVCSRPVFFLEENGLLGC